ncbi:MAG: hypothetical protein IPI94_07365 [Propionivibrio sp.]|nr:hypothetical protein [Propionivibrio sp.]
MPSPAAHFRKDLCRRLACLALLSFSPMLWAQTSAPAAAVPTPQTLEQADAQRERVKQMRSEAEQRYTTEQTACYKKFLVNSCLDDAKKRYTRTMIEARKLDIPAREFQRDAKRADVEAKEAQRAADLPRRESEQKEQAENYRATEATRAAARDKKRADKAVKAAEGRRKREAEQVKRQARQEKRAKKDAERAAKKAREAAKAEAKAAAEADVSRRSGPAQ